MVIGHNGQTRAMREFTLADPAPHGFGHAAELGVRATLNLIVALDFERDVVRPALRAFEKAVVESGHESWGIYTKKVFTAGCARSPKDASCPRRRFCFPEVLFLAPGSGI